MKSIDYNPELLIFENGLDALESFERMLNDGTPLPRLIFIDLNMPVMDGWDFMGEFTKRIPSEEAMPKIFIMTSSIDIKDVEKAKIYGLESHYLIKPVSGKVLETILR